MPEKIYPNEECKVLSAIKELVAGIEPSSNNYSSAEIDLTFHFPETLERHGTFYMSNLNIPVVKDAAANQGIYLTYIDVSPGDISDTITLKIICPLYKKYLSLSINALTQASYRYTKNNNTKYYYLDHATSNNGVHYDAGITFYINGDGALDIYLTDVEVN